MPSEQNRSHVVVLKINETRDGFKSFFAGMQEILRQVVQQQIEAQLETEVESCLHRGYHARRSGVYRRTHARCLRSVSSDPSAYELLGDTLSKEPLGPMYLGNDSQWGDVVNWSVYATFQAEEFGLTSENIDSMMGGDNIEIARFLGESEDNLGGLLGLDAAFAANIIHAVGNYDEIYQRNVAPIGVPREGSVNDSWVNGGLLYAPAWR
jgi:hypothetical protein